MWREIFEEFSREVLNWGNGVVCFSLGSRVGGNDVDGCGNDGGVVIFVHPLRASHASPSLCEGEV